jgi:hypothetical protein
LNRRRGSYCRTLFTSSLPPVLAKKSPSTITKPHSIASG